MGIKTSPSPFGSILLSSNLVVGIDCVKIVQRDPVIQPQRTGQPGTPPQLPYVLSPLGLTLGAIGHEAQRPQRLRPARVDGPTLYACMPNMIMPKCKKCRPRHATRFGNFTHTYPHTRLLAGRRQSTKRAGYYWSNTLRFRFRAASHSRRNKPSQAKLSQGNIVRCARSRPACEV